MILRVVYISIATVALAGALEGRQQPAPAAASPPKAPWFGTWQLVPPTPTSRFDAPVYKKVTLRIEPWEQGLRVIYDMVRARGGVTHVEWQGRFDGRDYPVQGMDYYLTNAYRQIDDGSYEIVIKVDGQPVATATAIVSPDGGTLTVTTVTRDARGQQTATAVYKRIT